MKKNESEPENQLMQGGDRLYDLALLLNVK